VRIISEESNRLITLVNSMLDLSKMEAGMLAYNFTEASLAPLIEKAVNEVLPLAESRDISIHKFVEELRAVSNLRSQVIGTQKYVEIHPGGAGASPHE
jgi:signal transduction histidine kinase